MRRLSGSGQAVGIRRRLLLIIVTPAPKTTTAATSKAISHPDEEDPPSCDTASFAPVFCGVDTVVDGAVATGVSVPCPLNAALVFSAKGERIQRSEVTVAPAPKT